MIPIAELDRLAAGGLVDSMTEIHRLGASSVATTAVPVVYDFTPHIGPGATVDTVPMRNIVQVHRSHLKLLAVTSFSVWQLAQIHEGPTPSKPDCSFMYASQ